MMCPSPDSLRTIAQPTLCSASPWCKCHFLGGFLYRSPDIVLNYDGVERVVKFLRLYYRSMEIKCQSPLIPTSQSTGRRLGEGFASFAVLTLIRQKWPVLLGSHRAIYPRSRGARKRQELLWFIELPSGTVNQIGRASCRERV